MGKKSKRRVSAIILIISVVILFIVFISPILTVIGFILKPIALLIAWFFKLLKKAIKELSSAKREQKKTE